MRSIVALLRTTDVASVKRFMSQHCKAITRGRVAEGKVGADLYFDREGASDSAEDMLPSDGPSTDYVQFGGDISGRIAGEKEVRSFFELALTEFGGFAFEEYTRHAWTLDQTRHGHQEEGHAFFDYRGWPEDSE